MYHADTIDADARRRQHAPDVVPPCMAMERANRSHVTDDQHRQHDPGRGSCAEDEREDHDRQQPHPGDAGLADADARCSDDREQPLHEVEVGH